VHKRQLATESWPVAEARILNSRIVRAPSIGGNRRQITIWRVEVEYEYSVQGRAYHGQRISARAYEEQAKSGKPSAALSSVLARYPTGAIVPVHHSARNPQNSFLEIDRSGSRLLFSIAACLALLGLGVLIVFALRR
jgi:hypothetical protein